MSDSSKLKGLNVTRNYTREKIDEIIGELRDLDSLTRAQKLQYVSKLKANSQHLQEADEKYLQSLWVDSNSDSQNETVYLAELRTIAFYNDRIGDVLVNVEENLKSDDRHSGTYNNNSSLKPKQAPLPHYSGEKNDSFERFFLTFEAVINSYNYTSFEKYLLLKQNCTGIALNIVNSLEVSNQSYEAAKNLLRDALASPIIQKFNTLQRLLDLKLGDDDCPYKFVGEMKSIKELVLNLQIDIEGVLQFFFWRSMNESMRDNLINITNTNKPTLYQIETNFFTAIERYNARKNASDMKSDDRDKNKKSTNFAVGIKSSDSKNKVTNNCALCNNMHPYFKCTVYKTPREKLQRVKFLGGCEKCALTNHKTDQCKLSNLKCKNCAGPHFPSLCPKVTDSNNQHKVSANIVWSTHSWQCQSGNDLLLPTITASVAEEPVRILKDSGAQMNFVTDQIANKCKLKVIEADVPMTINGFNVEKKCITKIVEIPLEFEEGNVAVINAVVVPEISIDLKLPKLGKLVEDLSDKYKLADKLLTQNCRDISDIGIVWGSEGAYCLPISTVSLGNHSVLLDTPYGFMLEGSISKLMEDLSSVTVSVSARDTLKSEQSVTSYVAQVDKIPENTSSDLNVQNKFASSYYELNGDAGVVDTLIEKAGNDILNTYCTKMLSPEITSDDTVQLNDMLSSFVLNNTVQLPDGRLQMPLMWNDKVAHNLGTNFNLAQKILKSNLQKLSKNPEYLAMTDKVFAEQEAMGVIEKIPDLNQFKNEYPMCSFLAHMSVFRPDKETTKCRVVYLSNLCEKSIDKGRNICHNQAIFSGPNLNSKLMVSILLLRFDKYLVTFDIRKAFLNIALPEVDQVRLLLLWFKDVTNKNYELVAYKSMRLPFGIACSPAILMLALHYILIQNCPDNDAMRNMCKLIYTLFYVDNGGYTANNINELKGAISMIIALFSKFKFDLQQFTTNSPDLQQELDNESADVTKENVNLLGLCWNRTNDTLNTKPLFLDVGADTKRKILATIAENFDPFLFHGPLLNRAKLFLHELQCDKSISWDKRLSNERLNEWNNIAKQLNASSGIDLPRMVGDRSSTYKLICFTDASKLMYRAVFYLQDTVSRKVSFVMAKNHVVTGKLANHTIPSMELHAAVTGLETLMQLYNDITNDKLLCPVRIQKLQLFCDSMVVLSWIDACSNKLNKNKNKQSIFVKNRLNKVDKLCEANPVEFAFVAGEENPADMISRPVSHKILSKSNYYCGPKFLSYDHLPVMSVTVPCPDLNTRTQHVTAQVTTMQSHEVEHLIPLNKYSSFTKLVKIYSVVLKAVEILKSKINLPNKLNENLYSLARNSIIARDQEMQFPECIEYFQTNPSQISKMPNLVRQLNVYMSSAGLLRVRSKFSRQYQTKVPDPILLSKHSLLTNATIIDLHCRMNHSGKYVLLAELRNHFYVPNYFSVVKRVIKDCTICARFNKKPVCLNQSPYREMRVSPPSFPFRYMYIDHIGPVHVKINGVKCKIYLLCISCMWSRYVNLKICRDLSVESFLRAFQMHVHQFGMPSKIVSDCGTSLIAGGNLIKDYIKDPSTISYLNEHNIENVSFSQYFRGNSALGSLVESAVKIVKKLIFGAVKNNVLKYSDMEFLVSEIISLINKRPVALKESTRDSNIIEAPTPITPELLIYGHVVPSVDCFAGLDLEEDSTDPDWTDIVGVIRNNFSQLNKIRKNLIDLYEGEFLRKLFDQAIDRKDRYIKKSHENYCKGDIVLLKEKFTKQKDYELGIVLEVQNNTLGETTGVTVRKGGNREVVNRHVNSIVPLLQDKNVSMNIKRHGHPPETRTCRPKRRAAVQAMQRMRSE